MKFTALTGVAALLLALPTTAITTAEAQQPAPAARITLEEAGRAMDAAEAEASSNGWNLSFVITDAQGVPIYVRRMDAAQPRSYDVAMNKTSTSITSGLHTDEYAAAVRDGRIPAIEGAFTFEGGYLMRRDGQVIGAFAASGAQGSQDAQAVRAGMAAIGIQP